MTCSHCTLDPPWPALPQLPLRYDHFDKSKLYVFYDGATDRLGRRSFTLWWWVEGYHLGPSWRAQCFHAVPENIIAKRPFVELDTDPVRTK